MCGVMMMWLAFGAALKAINAVRFDALPKRLRVVGIRALCPTAPFRNAAVRTFLRNLPPSCAHLATRGHRYTATSLHRYTLPLAVLNPPALSLTLLFSNPTPRCA